MSPLLWIFDPFFWLQVVILFSGLALVGRGLRGRKTGDAPHCSKCAYNLTGLTSQRCPECGAAIADMTPSRGRRMRQPVSLAIGAVLLVVCLARAGHVGYHYVKRVNWYNYRSFDGLLAEAQSGALEASNELQRRMRWRLLARPELDQLHVAALRMVQQTPPPRNQDAWFAILKKLGGTFGLSVDQTDALTRTALARAERGAADPHLSHWLDILTSCLAAQQLSEAQVRSLTVTAMARLQPDDEQADWNAYRWLDLVDELGAGGHLDDAQLELLLAAAAPRPRLAVRPRIRDGDCLPVELWLTDRIESPRRTRGRLTAFDLRIDGRTVIDARDPDDVQQRRHGDCLSGLELPAGRYEVECRTTYACSFASGSDPQDILRRSRVETRARTSFEVAAPGEPDGLSVISDTETASAFEQNFALRTTRRRRGNESTAYVFCGWTRDVPLDAIFDVVVQAGDQEYNAGTLVCYKSMRGRRFIGFPRDLLGESGAGPVRLVLRAAPEKARETVDLVEVWGGTLTLGPIDIEPLP